MSTCQELLEKHFFENKPMLFSDHKGKNGVYTLTFFNLNKVYVGSTGDLYARYRAHVNYLNNNNHYNQRLQNAFNRDPDIRFYFIPTETREQAYDLEQHLINIYKPTGLLFNVATDARYSGISHKHTEETKEKIRNASLGRKLSAEAKIKIGEASRLRAIGRTIPMDVRAKMSKARLGYKMSEESKRKLSISKTGLKCPNVYSEEGWKRIKQHGQKTAKHILINNVKYESITDASRILGIGRKTIKRRLKNKIVGWEYV